jgi:hypothetical protein
VLLLAREHGLRLLLLHEEVLLVLHAATFHHVVGRRHLLLLLLLLLLGGSLGVIALHLGAETTPGNAVVGGSTPTEAIISGACHWSHMLLLVAAAHYRSVLVVMVATLTHLGHVEVAMGLGLEDGLLLLLLLGQVVLLLQVVLLFLLGHVRVDLAGG